MRFAGSSAHPDPGSVKDALGVRFPDHFGTFLKAARDHRAGGCFVLCFHFRFLGSASGSKIDILLSIGLKYSARWHRKDVLSPVPKAAQVTPTQMFFRLYF